MTRDMMSKTNGSPDSSSVAKFAKQKVESGFESKVWTNRSVSDSLHEEELLQAARKGEADAISAILQKDVNINVNCRGKNKWNLHWTPLHLAAYFGHLEVARLLLSNGANSSVLNSEGDTPLHKAALTGREQIILLLLANDADVFAVNAEGLTARDVASEMYIISLLVAAEVAEKKRQEEAFFQAVKSEDLDTIQKLLCVAEANLPRYQSKQDDSLLLWHPAHEFSSTTLKNPAFDVNCVDAVGNSALHLAAHRNFCAGAVLLLQCGANPSLRNRRGLVPADLARSEVMTAILKVPPIRKIRNEVCRFEGPIIRKKRFLGKQLVWAVVDLGALSFFRNRVEASTNSHRKQFRYLDEALIKPDLNNERALDIIIKGQRSERLVAPTALERNRWLQAFKEHSSYATESKRQTDNVFINSIELIEHRGRTQDASSTSSLPLIGPLGIVHNAIRIAQAQQAVFDTSVSEAVRLHTSFLETSAQAGEFSIRAQNASHMLREQLIRVSNDGHVVVSCLQACLLLMKQHAEGVHQALAEANLPHSDETNEVAKLSKVVLQ